MTTDGTLFVIVGAGASWDAASSWPNPRLAVRPPLVKDLFDESHHSILAQYELAQSAAPEIRDALRGGDEAEAASLEQHLREQYRDAEDPYDKRRFFSISLYLQDLLWQASSTERVHFDNTDRLVSALLRNFEHVCFITLNYDLILDGALAKLDSLEEMDDYVSNDRWSLIKLHGSVNWGYAPLDDVSVDYPPADLDAHLDTEIQLARSPSSGSIRTSEAPRYIGIGGPSERRVFPALTVPVGEEDAVACPQEHQDHLDSLLGAVPEIDLLIAGYSAYDRTVIERIERSGKRIRSLMVVNAGQGHAEKVVTRLLDLLPDAMLSTNIQMTDAPFGQWCQTFLADFASSHPAAKG